MSWLRPDALLLDFGGTLVRERPSRGAIYAEAARRAGLIVEAEEMAALMGEVHDTLPGVPVTATRTDDASPTAAGLRGPAPAHRYTRPWFERFMEEIFVHRLGLAPTRLGTVAEELMERFADPATFELRPGTRELLERTRSLGIRTALVSNWSDALVGLVHGLRLEFDAVLSSADVGCEKPDRRIFELALARLDVPPERAWHAGDSWLNDVQGAERAGIRGIFVDHGTASGDPETGPGVRVGSLDQLSSWLAPDRRDGQTA